MGLDISFYCNVKAAPDADPDDLSIAEARVIPEFADRADGIQHGTLFTFGDSGSFRAGSYSGYGAFREELAKLAGYPAKAMAGCEHEHAAAAWQGAVADSSAFFPMVDFSDCEGTIGPQTSARLAKDFADYQAKADAHPDSWFREKYAEWRTAFEAVAGNGFVSFH